MSFKKRIFNVLNGQKPDKIPFFCFEELLPCGYFERKMRNAGMGLLLLSSPVLSFMPNVKTTKRISANLLETVYVTPKGSISFKSHTGTERIASAGWEVKTDFPIKDRNDYDALIYMIEDTVFADDLYEFSLKEEDLGEDGVQHIVGLLPPYTEAELLMGLEKWSLEQHDNPAQFGHLLQSLERRRDRQLEMMSAMDYCGLQHLGDISDNISPQNYIKYEVPHYRKTIKALSSQKRKCGIHAHAKFLKKHASWLAEVQPDFIESYTPPPYSDISLEELRIAVGQKVTILINFPETVFYQGYKKTRQYTTELLESDSSYNKAIGFSEMGLMGVNKQTRQIFEEGFMAVADAVNETGIY
ncbi:MAG: hypothetical protein FJW68_09065 [Actinobacteria bacterium]|nr:hypothetical protein [Actinomycetota bacterium]